MAEILKTVVITGPTATGKTALAVWLARIFNGEIVSVDSRQVYRGMDIGTGKDLDEYGEVPYHLIDIADPAREEYNLARFLPDAYRAIREQRQIDHPAPKSMGDVGGSGGIDKEFYTPDEVQRMSPAEVSKNFDKIRRSMTRWK